MEGAGGPGGGEGGGCDGDGGGGKGRGEGGGEGGGGEGGGGEGGGGGGGGGVGGGEGGGGEGSSEGGGGEGGGNSDASDRLAPQTASIQQRRVPQRVVSLRSPRAWCIGARARDQKALQQVSYFSRFRTAGGETKGTSLFPRKMEGCYYVKIGTEDPGPDQEGDGEIVSSQAPSALRRTSHSA